MCVCVCVCVCILVCFCGLCVLPFHFHSFVFTFPHYFAFSSLSIISLCPPKHFYFSFITSSFSSLFFTLHSFLYFFLLFLSTFLSFSHLRSLLFFVLSSFSSPLFLLNPLHFPLPPPTTLGKTLMSITIMWTLLNQGKIKGQPAVKKVVVACPTSLVGKKDIMQTSLLERFLIFCLEWYIILCEN